MKENEIPLLQIWKFICYCLLLLHFFYFTPRISRNLQNCSNKYSNSIKCHFFISFIAQNIKTHHTPSYSQYFKAYVKEKQSLFSQYMLNLLLHSIIKMGNKNISGLSSVITKNWLPCDHGPDLYHNKLTSETIREQVIKIQNINNFQDLKFRMKEKNPYICRVVFYSHYIHNLYYVFTQENRNKPMVKNLAEWQTHQKNIIQAFMALSERYGPTRVCREMIGVDNNGQIKIWINPNTALCQVLCPCQSKELMLEDIESIIDQISKQLKIELFPNLQVRSLELKVKGRRKEEQNKRGQKKGKGEISNRERLNWMKYGRSAKQKKLKKVDNKIKQISQGSDKSLEPNNQNERVKRQKQREKKSSSLVSNPEPIIPNYQKSFMSQLKSLAHHRTKSLTENAFRHLFQGAHRMANNHKQQQKTSTNIKKPTYCKRPKGQRANEKLIETKKPRGEDVQPAIQLLNVCIDLKQGRWSNKISEEMLEQQLNELFQQEKGSYNQNYYYEITKVY